MCKLIVQDRKHVLLGQVSYLHSKCHGMPVQLQVHWVFKDFQDRLYGPLSEGSNYWRNQRASWTLYNTSIIHHLNTKIVGLPVPLTYQCTVRLIHTWCLIHSIWSYCPKLEFLRYLTPMYHYSPHFHYLTFPHHIAEYIYVGVGIHFAVATELEASKWHLFLFFVNSWISEVIEDDLRTTHHQ